MDILLSFKNILKNFVPESLISGYHFFLSFLSFLLYRAPSQQSKMKVIGVTGTNGKSTVVEMIARILEGAGFSVAFISSLKFKIGDKEEKNELRMTMPGRFTIQRFLRQALDRHCDYAIIEVTSEGVKQHRHRFIDFDVAVFTNLAPEHIESHGSFKAYQRAKGKLFQATRGTHIINLDDEHADYFLQFSSQKKYGYTLEGKEREGVSIISASILPSTRENKTSFELDGTSFHLQLLGRFNIYNALAAIGVARSQDISLQTSKESLESVEGVPGRMEEVIVKPFRVIVDYAFTPQALEKVYQNLKNDFSPSKMICVLGACGGGRDKWKRPVLGEIASRYCQKVIIANEDPYDEDPKKIIEDVARGAKGKAEKIIDRREAIQKALSYAQAGDVVVITGKGSEPCICVAGGKKMPWDDRKVVREEFQKIREEATQEHGKV
ncbi:MAG: UDP-N-acetylmuramyl-tripeptide synthetase [Candidatus Nealsonbacteria bacterium]|nr:UDP-N-acetylmuramyl-tripeptide synthetase [Candidatus Nealsonbacteria bacterium]